MSGVRLLHPFTLSYHLSQAQQPLMMQGQQIYVLWNAVQPSATPPSLTAQTAIAPKGGDCQVFCGRFEPKFLY